MGLFSSLGSLFGALIPGAGPIAGALGGLFDSGTDMYSNYHNMQLQFAHQKALAQQQQEYNIQNAQQQFEYNKYYQERQFQQQQQATREANEYNSPTQQMKRLGDAGINPFVALSNNLGSSGTQSSVPSGSGGSASLPSVGLPNVPLNPYSYANSVANISSSLRNIADAKKSGVETNWLEDSMKDALRNLKNEADQKELQNIILQIQSSTENERQRNLITKTLKEIDNLTAETDLAKEKKWTEKDIQNNYEALSQKFWAEREKAFREAEISDEQLALIRKYGDIKYRAEIDEIRSRANYNNEQANDLRATRSSRIANLQADASFKGALSRVYTIDADIRDANKADEISVNFDRLFREHFFSKEFDEALYSQLKYYSDAFESARSTQDWRACSQILSVFQQIVDIGLTGSKIGKKGSFNFSPTVINN